MLSNETPAYLQHHIDPAEGLDDMVKTAHMLMTQVFHGFNFSLHTRQVILEINRGKADQQVHTWTVVSKKPMYRILRRI